MKTQWYQIILFVLAVIILAIFLYLVRSVLPPFVIAFVIAWLLDPVMDRLQCRGCPRIAAVTAVFAIFLAAFVVAMVFLVPAVVDQAVQFGKDYPNYAEGFKLTATEFLDRNHTFLARFELPTTLQEAFAKYGNQANEGLKTAIPRVSDWVKANLSKALWIVLIPLVSFYFLNDIDRIREKAVLFIPEGWRPKAVKVLSRMGAVFSNYVRGLVVICLLYGAATTIVLLALNLKYGIILGLLAGILYAVPYIGAILTAVLVFLVGLATNANGLHSAIIATTSILVTNQVFDMAVTPKILGKSVGLHPILSMFALLAGGQLFGLPGMILAVPVAASIQEIVYEFYPQIRPAPEVKKPNRIALWIKYMRKRKGG